MADNVLKFRSTLNDSNTFSGSPVIGDVQVENGEVRIEELKQFSESLEAVISGYPGLLRHMVRAQSVENTNTLNWYLEKIDEQSENDKHKYKAIDDLLKGTELVPLSIIAIKFGQILIIACVFSLAVWFLEGTILLHPALSGMFIFFGLGILLMGKKVPDEISKKNN